MNTFEFTLRFALGGSALAVDEVVEALGECGCDDALVGVGHVGRVALAFTREAASAREAVFSALTDVRRALPNAQLVEVAPDLVGLSDIAEIMGFSRQNMRKQLMQSGAGGPAPVHEGNPSLWHLADVLVWLGRDRGYAIPSQLIELAALTMQLNLAVESVGADADLQRDIRAVLA